MEGQAGRKEETFGDAPWNGAVDPMLVRFATKRHRDSSRGKEEKEGQLTRAPLGQGSTCTGWLIESSESTMDAFHFLSLSDFPPHDEHSLALYPNPLSPPHGVPRLRCRPSIAPFPVEPFSVAAIPPPHAAHTAMDAGCRWHRGPG